MTHANSAAYIIIVDVLTDILAGAVGGRGRGGRCVAADVAVGETLGGIDDARRSARHWRQTTVDAATQ